MGFILPRLAIGLSQSPNVFDKSAVLPLCYSDPPSLRGPAFVKLVFQDHADPIYAVREVTDFTSPRGFRRTGYGTRLRWLVSLSFETVSPSSQFGGAGAVGLLPDTPGGLATPFSPNQFPTDNSLFSLASAFGRSSPGVGSGDPITAPGPDNPPYMFLTTSYQMSDEQWWPVELSSTASQTTAEQPFTLKTFVRTMDFEFTTRKTYNRVFCQYEAALVVHSGSGTVTGLTAPSAGRTVATITLSAALRADMNVGDTILIRFENVASGGGPFVFYRFNITSINGPRTTIQANCPTPPWPYGAGPLTMNYWTQQVDPFYFTPLYMVDPFVDGDIPPNAFSPNIPVTQLIGDQA